MASQQHYWVNMEETDYHKKLDKLVLIIFKQFKIMSKKFF